MQLPVLTNKCKAFLGENKKADIQWELEQRLEEFEKNIALEHYTTNLLSFRKV